MASYNTWPAFDQTERTYNRQYFNFLYLFGNKNSSCYQSRFCVLMEQMRR